METTRPNTPVVGGETSDKTTGYRVEGNFVTPKKQVDKYNNLNLANAAYKHDQIMADKAHEELKIRLGVLGQFFGHEENSSKNITFVLLVILLIIALVMTFYFSKCIIISKFVSGLWDNMFPIITLSLGYIFGKK